MEDLGILEFAQEYASMLFEIKYMVALFLCCFYLFRYSPWKDAFVDKSKWTLLIALILAMVAITFKFFEIGIGKDLWQYHFRILVSFFATTSFYDHIAYYIINWLDSKTGKKSDV